MLRIYSPYACHRKPFPIRRAFTNDCLSDFIPQKSKALVAVRGTPPSESLILRLASRKHLPAGCLLRPPCFCALAKVTAHAMCPVHFFWPEVRRRCRSGDLLIPTTTRRNVNTILRAILKKLELPHAERYSSHGFRRGAASELHPTGPQWSTVATIGDWRSLAFKGYVDLANELSRDLPRLLAEDIVLGEEDEKDD